MGRTIYFTEKELLELEWIVPEFATTHEEHYEEGEREVVESIINKIIDL